MVDVLSLEILGSIFHVIMLAFAIIDFDVSLVLLWVYKRILFNSKVNYLNNFKS